MACFVHVSKHYSFAYGCCLEVHVQICPVGMG